MIGERAARAQCLVLSIEIFDTYVRTLIFSVNQCVVAILRSAHGNLANSQGNDGVDNQDLAPALTVVDQLP
jgi:hypothetical protein